MSYNWNWSIFWAASPEGGTYLDMLLQGLRVTIVTSLCAWILAFLIGSGIGILRTLPSRWARGIGAAHVELFRNIPLLVQLFIWFFVVPELLPSSWGTWLKQLPQAPFLTAVIGIALFMSTRVAEHLRAGIGALSAGLQPAGLALGMTRAQTYRYLLLPNAYRIILPPLTSEFLNTVKNSSVALTIGLIELTARTRAMQEFSFQVFEAFTAATLLYLLLNFVVVLLMRGIERLVAVPGLVQR